MNLDDHKDCAVADAWDQLSKAIFSVSVAQPNRLGAAVEELLSARSDMAAALILALSHDQLEEKKE